MGKEGNKINLSEFLLRGSSSNPESTATEKGAAVSRTLADIVRVLLATSLRGAMSDDLAKARSLIQDALLSQTATTWKVMDKNRRDSCRALINECCTEHHLTRADLRLVRDADLSTLSKLVRSKGKGDEVSVVPSTKGTKGAIKISDVAGKQLCDLGGSKRERDSVLIRLIIDKETLEKLPGALPTDPESFTAYLCRCKLTRNPREHMPSDDKLAFAGVFYDAIMDGAFEFAESEVPASNFFYRLFSALGKERAVWTAVVILYYLKGSPVLSHALLRRTELAIKRQAEAPATSQSGEPGGESSIKGLQLGDSFLSFEDLFSDVEKQSSVAPLPAETNPRLAGSPNFRSGSGTTGTHSSGAGDPLG